MAQQVANVVLRDKLTAAATPNGVVLSQAALDRDVGRFELLPGIAATVERRGAGLEMRALGRTMKLTALTDSTFASDMLPGTFSFPRLADGRIGLYAPALGMDAAAPPLRPAPVLSARDRQNVVGKFYSEELLAIYTVKDDGVRLIVRGGYGDWMPMEPFQPDEFSNGSAKLTATRDRSGKVSTLTLNAGRMRNITFVRVP